MTSVVTELDVEYGRVGSRPLLLDLLRPAPGPVPAAALIWLHGGGWWAGNKRNAIRLHMLDHLDPAPEKPCAGASIRLVEDGHQDELALRRVVARLGERGPVPAIGDPGA